MRKKTHEEFVRDLNKVHGEGVYIPLEKYVDNKTKILVRHNCKKCDHYEWLINPSHLLRGQGCPKCAGGFKKTTEDFKREIKEKYREEYEVLGEYLGANTKILVRHNKCGHEWESTPSNLLRGHGCPICGLERKKRKQTKAHEKFVREVREKYGNKYIVLGEYIKSDTKILIRHNCDKCNNYEWEIRPSNLLSGQGCPICGKIKSNQKRTKTHEEFFKDVKEKYSDEYIVLEEYKGANIKIKVRHNCNKCNYHEYKVRPISLLKGTGCPICGKKRNAKNRTKTHEEFVKEVKKKYSDEYEILEKYKNAATKILVKHNCSKCNNHEWRTTPNNLLRGTGCPVCANQKTVLGINTIWDTDRWMCNLGVSEEDAKKYASQSNKKITVKCPDCGKEKKIQINNMYRNKSISCSCGDGKSYPEKFIMNVLEQLGLDFETEYSPKWIENKRYDFYIKDSDCIIETHGRQHYNNKTFKYGNGRTLKEEQENDKYKREIALSNDIKYYIELDCRESSLEYIKNSILNSELAKLFDLSNINWQQCAEFANKNIVKEVCEYWNNKKENETTVDVGKVFNLNRHTIVVYLKKGVKLDWCEYDPVKEDKKARSKVGKSKGKKVEIFKDNKSLGVFSSCHELDRQSEILFGIKLSFKGISSSCRGKLKSYKGFTFKYVEEDNNSNISKIA